MKPLKRCALARALLIFTRGSGMLMVKVIAKGLASLRKRTSSWLNAAGGGGAWRGIVQFWGL